MPAPACSRRRRCCRLDGCCREEHRACPTTQETQLKKPHAHPGPRSRSALASGPRQGAGLVGGTQSESPLREAEPLPGPPPARLLYCAGVGVRAGAELLGRSAYLHLGLDQGRSYEWAGHSVAAQLIHIEGWGIAVVKRLVYGFLQCFFSLAGSEGRKTIVSGVCGGEKLVYFAYSAGPCTAAALRRMYSVHDLWLKETTGPAP